MERFKETIRGREEKNLRDRPQAREEGRNLRETQMVIDDSEGWLRDALAGIIRFVVGVKNTFDTVPSVPFILLGEISIPHLDPLQSLDTERMVGVRGYEKCGSCCLLLYGSLF